MAKTKKDDTQTDAPTEPAMPADSAAAIYRDKAGRPFATSVTEGASNFGAVTAAARAILGPDTPDAA